MKNQPALHWLLLFIGLLALFAASMGLFYQRAGQPYAYTNHRGETVMINGQGLYFYDTVSMAAQQQGNDVVTLLVGLPLLAISTWLAFRGSLRGRLLLTGTLGLGVSAMAINMTLKGVPDSLGIMIPFSAITLMNLVMAVLLLKNVDAERRETSAAST